MNTTTKIGHLYPDSFPIGTLTEYPPEWALTLMVDLYEATIRGEHGFGIRHPRALWLRLVVSSSAECGCCWGRARWEDVVTGVRFCPGCAEGEIAAHGAAQLFRKAVEADAIPRYRIVEDGTAPLQATA